MEFKEQVKFARQKMGLSQTALAKELGVSFPTINRWENGHGEPHSLAKNAFFDLCKKKNVRFEEGSQE